MIRSFVRSLSVLASAAVCCLGLAPAALAQPTELFFSEYIEGSSNNKALEIFNGTGLAVNLAANGYNVQMHFNGSPTAGLTINLTGTVAAGDVYVVAQASANAASSPRPTRPTAPAGSTATTRWCCAGARR